MNTTKQLTPQQIRERLEHNTGSQYLYKNHNIHITDGVKEMADLCQAYWLIDVVRSCQYEPKVKAEPFQVFHLDVDTTEQSAELTVTDGNKNVLYTQEIPYSDFPLESIDIWFQNGVAYLPSEH